MNNKPPGGGAYTAGVEKELRELSDAMTRPAAGECVVCYVFRMLDFGCSGHHWLQRYRDLRAPRATALERRMERLGGYCDCETIMNAFCLSPSYFTWDEDGEIATEEMPRCFGVRAGSTQPCPLWMSRIVGPWRGY